VRAEGGGSAWAESLAGSGAEQLGSWAERRLAIGRPAGRETLGTSLSQAGRADE
jgi:hypothetical protein